MKNIALKNIALRAAQLEGLLTHGHACYAACREAGIQEHDIECAASIVSTMLTNGVTGENPRPTAEDWAAFDAAKAECFRAIRARLQAKIAAAEAAGRETMANQFRKRLAALNSGQPDAALRREADENARKKVPAIGWKFFKR